MSAEERPDRFKNGVAVAIALLTVCAAVTAWLQADAAARDDRANRDSKRYATEAFGRKVGGEAQTNYDYFTAYQAWYEFDTLADSAEQRGDTKASKRYATMRDRMLKLTPLLAPPYFDAEKREVDFARYEADRYVEEIAALTERFDAASGVKEAWDAKANTYIVHLTLLAVALALLGLSTTLPGAVTRTLFAAVAGGIAGVAVIWAGMTWASPVPDLRASDGAIEAFSKGVGFAHREQWTEAIKSFDLALQKAPDYAHALAERGDAKAKLEKWADAAADHEKARAAGDQRAAVAGMLGWEYYLLGRFDDAVAIDTRALATDPAELWIRFDLGLTHLAAGRADQARAAFQAGMDAASKLIADAREAKQEAPSIVWESLDDAGESLDALVEVIDGDKGQAPEKAKIATPDATRKLALETITEIKSLAVALEYTGKPPAPAPTAKLDGLRFAALKKGESAAAEEATEFETGTSNVAVRFDFEGVKPDAEMVVKVYHEGEEDPSWRFVGPWKQGPKGTFEQPVAPARSDTWTLPGGEYLVEVYLDSHLMQRGGFEVKEGAAAAEE